MRLLGNILWLLLGGILMGLLWLAIGCIWCITIVGIPMGSQCFRCAAFAVWPFGRDFVHGEKRFPGFVNLIWMLVFGWELALICYVIAFMYCVTIIGIPFGKQFFKLGRLAAFPFGATFHDCSDIRTVPTVIYY